MLSNKRFGRNYTLASLELAVDRRGFRVGQSRLGFARLDATPAGLIDVLDDFTSISVGIGCTVVDGAWLTHDVTTLSLTSRNPALFGEYDGEPITLTYAGQQLFDGYVETSTLASQLDDDGEEQFTVGVTCRGFEAVPYQLPPVDGVRRLYGTPENPGTGYSTGRGAERVHERAAAITGGDTVTWSGDLARSLLDERLAAVTEQQGNQGTLVQELAHRAGLLADLSGTAPRFRDYRTVPHWRIDDDDITSYAIATDRESPGALLFKRAEDETQYVAYAGSGTNPIERTFSDWNVGLWGLNTTAAMVPLKSSQDVHLAGFTAPFKAGTTHVSRHAPFKVTLQHDGWTYRGTALRLTHTITPARWLTSVECGPVHLATRRSDVFPSNPDHFRGSVSAGTATLRWSTGTVGTAAGSAVAGNYVVLTDAEAANVDIGDEVQVFTSGGALRDPRIFTVLSKPSAFGFTNVTFDGSMGTVSATGDTLRFPDYGAAPVEWRLYWRDNTFPNRVQVSPNDGLGPTEVRTTSPVATVSGLAPGSYLFTVFAYTADGYRSGPSRSLTLVVT